LKNGNPCIIGQEFKKYSFLEFYPILCNSQDMNVFTVSNNLIELYFCKRNLKKSCIPHQGDKFCVFPFLHSDLIQDIQIDETQN